MDELNHTLQASEEVLVLAMVMAVLMEYTGASVRAGKELRACAARMTEQELERCEREALRRLAIHCSYIIGNALRAAHN